MIWRTISNWNYAWSLTNTSFATPALLIGKNTFLKDFTSEIVYSQLPWYCLFVCFKEKVIDFIYFFIIIIVFLLYNIVLVFPYINMHLPRVYKCSHPEPPFHLPPQQRNTNSKWHNRPVRPNWYQYMILFFSALFNHYWDLFIFQSINIILKLKYSWFTMLY